MKLDELRALFGKKAPAVGSERRQDQGEPNPLISTGWDHHEKGLVCRLDWLIWAMNRGATLAFPEEDLMKEALRRKGLPEGTSLIFESHPNMGDHVFGVRSNVGHHILVIRLNMPGVDPYTARAPYVTKVERESSFIVVTLAKSDSVAGQGVSLSCDDLVCDYDSFSHLPEALPTITGKCRVVETHPAKSLLLVQCFSDRLDPTWLPPFIDLDGYEMGVVSRTAIMGGDGDFYITLKTPPGYLFPKAPSTPPRPTVRSFRG